MDQKNIVSPTKSDTTIWHFWAVFRKLEHHKILQKLPSFCWNCENTIRCTLKTFIWHEAICKLLGFFSCEYVSIWIRNGTPFSPPCFFGVNSVLMQFTWKRVHKSKADTIKGRREKIRQQQMLISVHYGLHIITLI